MKQMVKVPGCTVPAGVPDTEFWDDEQARQETPVIIGASGKLERIMLVSNESHWASS
jgi:hypothetical protein